MLEDFLKQCHEHEKLLIDLDIPSCNDIKLISLISAYYLSC